VVLVDDHPLFLEALGRQLEADGIEVAGTTTRAEEAVTLASDTSPDIVLLDLRMPGMDGLDALQQLRTKHPDVKVVILSGEDDSARIERALAAGAAAFVVKTASGADIAHALRAVTGDTAVYYTAPRGAPEPTPDTSSDAAGLTKREREILTLVAAGHSNARLGRMLWVTEQTIKFHLSNIYRKLGVSNRTEAAARAYALGLIPDADAASE
jgi:DNA-binding NarL/FixJ family response regulator